MTYGPLPTSGTLLKNVCPLPVETDAKRLASVVLSEAVNVNTVPLGTIVPSTAAGTVKLPFPKGLVGSADC